MAKIYALANQKGGVGKTTTAVNLGAYLAAAGRRVLLVDVDPQANATSSLGVGRQTVARSTYDVLLDGAPADRAILLTQLVHLDLLPSTTALAGAEVELVGLMAREYRLARALEPVVEQYDYVFLDCPPSLGLLTINALAAARNGVVIPVQCEYLALEGLGHLDLHGAGQPESGFDHRRVGADHVRRAHKPGQAGGGRGAALLSGLRLSDHHPPHRPAQRGSQLRRSDPALCAGFGRCSGLPGAGRRVFGEGRVNQAAGRGAGSRQPMDCAIRTPG
jgi:hypothetical protein